jgi:hypothetical protein
MRPSPRLFVTLTIAALAAEPGVATGAECSPPTRESTCLDPDPLWTSAVPSGFLSVGAARAMPRHAWAFGLDTIYLLRPVVLTTRSPDPDGREIRVVDDAVNVTASAAYAPWRHSEVSLGLPVSLYRTGTGMSGVTSQSGPGLPATALRDLRLGMGHQLLATAGGAGRPEVLLMSRLTLTLPTGAAASFAGERGPVLAPSLSVAVERGILVAAAEQGVRLREPVDLGGARLGTQIVSAVGFGVKVLDQGRLTIAAESWVMPSLTSGKRTLPNGEQIATTVLTPAEWLLSAWTRLGPVTVAIGGGTGLPLSQETRRDSAGVETTTHFAGVTSPRVRLGLVVRYETAPLGD